MNIQLFDYSVDVLRALIWPFNNAQNLRGLLDRKQDWYHRQHQQFWESWYTDVFDLRTANDFGLAVWARILDFPITVMSTESPDDYPTWGFSSIVGADENLPIRNFGNGNFATPPDALDNLSTDDKRLLLRLRYFNLITPATVPNINRIVEDVFIDNYVYVLDNNDMTITYIFSVIPDEKTLFLIDEFDILPRPSGVSYDILIVPQVTFGFDEYRQNFDRGNFFSLIGRGDEEEDS